VAMIPDLLIKNMEPPPHEIIPRAVWIDVVEQIGELVIAHMVPGRNHGGQLQISFRLNDLTLEKVKSILRRHSGEPWASEPFEGSDPDAWRNA